MIDMPRGHKSPVRKAPNDQRDYPPWKAKAAKELKDRHHIEAIGIAERIWMQFYVRRLDPKEAARRAEIVYHRARPVTSWLKKE
jgi:hypothetical protein